MKFSEGEMVFHRLAIRSKATNVGDIESKIIRGSVKTPEVVSRGQSDLGTFVVSSPDENSEAGCGKAILNFDLKSVKSVKSSNVM